MSKYMSTIYANNEHDGGACTLYREAREFGTDPENWSDEMGEELNEEASGQCSAYEECCLKACSPYEVTEDECF